MNVPNVLTVFRVFLTILFAVCAQSAGVYGAWAACAVFALAVVTDFIDGYIARKLNLVTVFGQIMDPVADKFLTLTAMFIFAFEGLFPLWMVALIAMREILVTAVRIYALTNGTVIPAESAGKLKAALQMTAVLLVLVVRALSVTAPTQEFIRIHEFSLSLTINGIMIVAMAVTLWSGLVFLKNVSKGVK
jgi:CDP-diacylglycerol--glycerol-3-phosphate 3-phosphatidyltransferase